MAKNNEKAIQEAAYYIWQSAGCPMGNDEYFWALATEQFNCSTKSKAAASSSAATKKSPVKKPVAAKKPAAKKK